MEGESFKGRNMKEEMEAKAKLSPGETTVARETDGLTGDEAEDALNARMKLPIRKRFVRTEEIPSGAPSMEDQVEQRMLEKEEEERLAQIEDTHNVRDEDYEESSSGITGVEVSEEPSHAIKVNGMDISSAVSGSSMHQKATINSGRYDESLKTSKRAGKEHDSTQQRRKKMAMRDKKLSSEKK